MNENQKRKPFSADDLEKMVLERERNLQKEVGEPKSTQTRWEMEDKLRKLSMDKEARRRRYGTDKELPGDRYFMASDKLQETIAKTRFLRFAYMFVLMESILEVMGDRHQKKMQKMAEQEKKFVEKSKNEIKNTLSFENQWGIGVAKENGSFFDIKDAKNGKFQAGEKDLASIDFSNVESHMKETSKVSYESLDFAIDRGAIDLKNASQIFPILFSTGEAVKPAGLSEEGSKVWERSLQMFREQELRIMNTLLDKGMSPNLEKDGHTLLTMALNDPHRGMGMMHSLIERGADVNVLLHNDTPLTLARTKEDIGILLNAGARLQERFYNNETVAGRSFEHMIARLDNTIAPEKRAEELVRFGEMLKLMKQEGLDLGIPNAKGQSVLERYNDRLESWKAELEANPDWSNNLELMTLIESMDNMPSEIAAVQKNPSPTLFIDPETRQRVVLEATNAKTKGTFEERAQKIFGLSNETMAFWRLKEGRSEFPGKEGQYNFYAKCNEEFNDFLKNAGEQSTSTLKPENFSNLLNDVYAGPQSDTYIDKKRFDKGIAVLQSYASNVKAVEDYTVSGEGMSKAKSFVVDMLQGVKTAESPEAIQQTIGQSFQELKEWCVQNGQDENDMAMRAMEVLQQSMNQSVTNRIAETLNDTYHLEEYKGQLAVMDLDRPIPGNKDGNNLLMIALYSNNKDLVRTILSAPPDAQPNLHFRNAKGVSIAEAAMEYYGNTGDIQTLLQILPSEDGGRPQFPSDVSVNQKLAENFADRRQIGRDGQGLVEHFVQYMEERFEKKIANNPTLNLETAMEQERLRIAEMLEELELHGFDKALHTGKFPKVDMEQPPIGLRADQIEALQKGYETFTPEQLETFERVGGGTPGLLTYEHAMAERYVQAREAVQNELLPAAEQLFERFMKTADEQEAAKIQQELHDAFAGVPLPIVEENLRNVLYEGDEKNPIPVRGAMALALFNVWNQKMDEMEKTHAGNPLQMAEKMGMHGLLHENGRVELESPLKSAMGAIQPALANFEARKHLPEFQQKALEGIASRGMQRLDALETRVNHQMAEERMRAEQSQAKKLTGPSTYDADSDNMNTLKMS